MDVRLRFGKEFREYDDRTCIIVIDVDNMFVGLIVDSVCEVMSIPDGRLLSHPILTKVKTSLSRA